MNAPTAITTFSQDYYRRYGREGLSSLVQHWPGKIVAYYEYEAPNEFTDRVEYRDLFDQPECVHFVKWTGMIPQLQGYRGDGEYFYQYNAHKFGRKVFAITDYAKEREPFFFIGADVRAVKTIPVEFLTEMMDGKAGVFLRRQHLNMHLESDFAGYNPLFPKMEKLLAAYRKAFTHGTFLELKEWHDCLVLDALIDALQLGHDINNLSDGIEGEGRLGKNVWPNTVLSEYMVHLKGNLKKGGVAA